MDQVLHTQNTETSGSAPEPAPTESNAPPTEQVSVDSSMDVSQTVSEALTASSSTSVETRHYPSREHRALDSFDSIQTRDLSCHL